MECLQKIFNLFSHALRFQKNKKKRKKVEILHGEGEWKAEKHNRILLALGLAPEVLFRKDYDSLPYLKLSSRDPLWLIMKKIIGELQ